MPKLVSLLIPILVLFGLTACGDSDSQDRIIALEATVELLTERIDGLETGNEAIVEAVQTFPEIGERGPAGPTGLVGLRGPRGEQGISGATGSAGLSGPQGGQGEQGPQGEKGQTGVAG